MLSNEYSLAESRDGDFILIVYQDEKGNTYRRITYFDGLKLSEQNELIQSIYDHVCEGENEMWFWSDYASCEENPKTFDETFNILSEIEEVTGTVGFFEGVNDDIAVYPLIVCLFVDDRTKGVK